MLQMLQNVSMLQTDTNVTKCYKCYNMLHNVTTCYTMLHYVTNVTVLVAV